MVEEGGGVHFNSLKAVLQVAPTLRYVKKKKRLTKYLIEDFKNLER
jgi:hypothetical protein